MKRSPAFLKTPGFCAAITFEAGVTLAKSGAVRHPQRGVEFLDDLR